jgi:hypothetical protein
MLEDVQAVPSPIAFGVVRVGTQAKESIVLRSAAGQPFQVEAIETGSGDTQVIASGPLAEGEQKYLLTQRVTKPGHHSELIRFRLRPTLSGKPESLVLPVSWYGSEEK